MAYYYWNIFGLDTSLADLAVQVIKLRKFIDGFLSKHNLLVPLMAVKNWDLANNQLLVDDNLYNVTLLRQPEGLRGSEPTVQEAYGVLEQMC